ncbi:MAG: hypothetical protein O8C66_12110 [Candidatus Methanoperedens sp.]|nr:hypothetical protein [Candidatus Methanoperedens sp.]MCZ7371245.1 hypothetical protein [Candidatus Methanoperedens sp.]
MLETPRERVELLKAGISGKKIEELYIKHNNFRIVDGPFFFEMVEIDTRGNQNFIQETAAACEYV